jgi:hypothetical protein
VVKLGLNTTVSNTFTLQDKTIYRFPNLDLPMQKVNLLKEKYNLKVIRDHNKADIHVVSNLFFEKLFNTEWGTSSSFPYFFGIIKALKAQDLLTNEALDKFKNIINTIGTKSMVKLGINYGRSQNTGLENAVRTLWKDEKHESYESKDIVLKNKYHQTYLNIKNSTTTTIYDTDLINKIDDQLAIIDNTEYDVIHKMIISNDKDNRSLALEMLANCNLDKSYDVVSGIFYWNYDYLKEAKNWNSVNTKALRKRMDAYKEPYGIHTIYPYNKYIQLLIEDKKLTKFALNKTRQHLYNNVLNNLIGDNASIFNVSFDNLNLKESLIENIIQDD